MAWKCLRMERTANFEKVKGVMFASPCFPRRSSCICFKRVRIFGTLVKYSCSTLTWFSPCSPASSSPFVHSVRLSRISCISSVVSGCVAAGTSASWFKDSSKAWVIICTIRKGIHLFFREPTIASTVVFPDRICISSGHLVCYLTNAHFGGQVFAHYLQHQRRGVSGSELMQGILEGLSYTTHHRKECACAKASLLLVVLVMVPGRPYSARPYVCDVLAFDVGVTNAHFSNQIFVHQLHQLYNYVVSRCVVAEMSAS